MSRRLPVLAALFLLAACSSAAVTPVPPPASTTATHAPTSHTHSTAAPSSSPPAALEAWPVPDDKLTPGAVVAGCTYPRHDKRGVTAVTKALVARWYDYTGPGGLTHVEYDHRVPFSLCGADSPANIWPEPADGVKQSTYIHNRKDQLEGVIAGKVRRGEMSLPDAQALFEGDWRLAWCRYVHSPGVRC